MILPFCRRFCACLLVLPGWLAAAARPRLQAEPAAAPLQALVVGGGPDTSSNAAQIEGHVRFVASRLPPGARRVVLFADGKADTRTVSYTDTGVTAEAERALAVLLTDRSSEEGLLDRPAELGVPVDGPARLTDFRRALGKLSAQAARGSTPLLLYFAGHGTQDKKSADNTHYDLWDGDELKVRALADEVSRLPRQVPVVLVMAQCFSGAFAHVLFTQADIYKAPIKQNVVGFFSTRLDREASGCSYATERADYQDFSSYFFGALSGQDRFGDKVTGADFDGDGVVTLHEAFCYALIHDLSADTPECTSDVFLRHQAFRLNQIVYATPYHEVWQAGTPAQRAALDALSERVGLGGEARALAIHDRLIYHDPAARPELIKRQAEARERLRNARQAALDPLFERHPVLRWGSYDTGAYHKDHDGAVADLVEDKGLRRSLIEVARDSEQAEEAVESEEAALLRFASLYTHIVEASELRSQGSPEVRARFEQLWQAEQRPLPLRPAS